MESHNEIQNKLILQIEELKQEILNNDVTKKALIVDHKNIVKEKEVECDKKVNAKD